MCGKREREIFLVFKRVRKRERENELESVKKKMLLTYVHIFVPKQTYVNIPHIQTNNQINIYIHIYLCMD